jgi:hypothetical protein
VSSFIGHDQGITIAKQYNAIHHYILCSWNVIITYIHQ